MFTTKHLLQIVCLLTGSAALVPAWAQSVQVALAKPSAQTVDVQASAPNTQAMSTPAATPYAVHVGQFPCAEKVSVSVQPDQKRPDHYHLHLGKIQYPMKAVDTSTGVVRLEDAKSGLVWLQLGNKSMLMNSKIGRRLADECMSPQQVAVADSLKNQVPQDLFAKPEGAR